MTQASARFVINRWPVNDEELYHFVPALWGFRIPNTVVCPNHKTPFQAFADAYFARYPVTVWKASRGFGGKTNILSLLSLTEAVCLGAQISLLGGSGAQSQNVHATNVEAWNCQHSPRQLLAKDPTKFDTHFSNGGYIRSLMASQTSVRGPHPQRLRLDEIDEMELAILEAAQGQPMRKRGIDTQTVMSSTHQHPDGTMTEILLRAAKQHWPVYEWCYRESANPIDGWLTMDEIERKRSEIPQHMWDTEYDLQEPSFEGRAIDTQKVELCFDPDLGSFSGQDKLVLESAQPHHIYVTGIDWAKEQDWTIVSTFDATTEPWTCVAWQKMGRLPWPVMINRACLQWKDYGGDLVHDATGIGNVVDDLLPLELPPSALRNIKPVVMGAGRARQDLFSDYVAAIENEKIKYPRIEFAYREHKYCLVEDLYGRGHPPDSLVAGAMAWSVRKQRIPKFTMSGGGTKSSVFDLP